jgi:predicted amidohydrolase
MPLDQVIARATLNASRVFEVFHDRGTLNVGAPADRIPLHSAERAGAVRPAI